MSVLLRLRYLCTVLLLLGAAGASAAAERPAGLGEDLNACTGAPTGYCAAKGEQPWQEWISHVTVGNLQRASSKEQYHFYAFDGPAQLRAGQQVRIKLTPGLSWSGQRSDLYWSVYVDYNRDGDFEDAGEQVLRQRGINKAVDASITIPTAISDGCTRIRITMKKDGYAGPCGTFAVGEVEDFLATLSGGGGGGGGGDEVCADRTATDSRQCSDGTAYGFFGDIVRGVTGDSDYFKVVGGKFVESTDGTARFTGRLVNVGNAHVAFDATVDFSGRTKRAPAGSPKALICGGQADGADAFYYYPVANGTLTGRGALAGGRLRVTRTGEAFQLGVGANGNEANRFGGSGWFSYTVAAQPTGHASFLTEKVVDINVLLSGGAAACFPPAPSSITLNCPATQTFQVAAGQTQVAVDYSVPTASTTCATDGLTLAKASGPNRGALRGPGTYTVTYRATDACGNSETCSFSVVVTAPPAGTSISLTCPPDVTTPQIADYGADVFIPVPTASTTCPQGGLTFSYSPALPANRTPHFPVGTTTVTVTARDACGNTATCTFDVTVTPSGGGGGDCAGNGPDYPCGGATVGGWEPWWEWIARVQFGSIDNASGKEAYKFFPGAGKAQVEPGAKVTLTVTPGLSYPQYVTELYYTAYIDFNGDGDFEDAGEEVLRKRTTSKGVTQEVHVPAGARAGVTRLRVIVQRGQYAGPCENFSFGEVEDYLVCIGGNGNPPASAVTIDCPADRTVQIAQGQTQATVNYPLPTANTTCGAGGLQLARVSGPARGSQRGAGTYTVRYRATDACGNQAECTFRVVVKAAPVQTNVTIDCPADKTIQIAAGQTQAKVTYATPTARTTCGSGGLKVERVSGPASGHDRGAGTYTVRYRATDACGNQAECTFRVVVEAAPAPSCSRVTSGLVALYDFDTGSGTTVFDRSGFGTPLNLHLDASKVSWLPDCGIQVKGHTVIRSATAATKVTRALKQTNEVTIEAWVRTADLWQRGPARIVTISKDIHSRNLTLGQEDVEYAARLRTTHTDHNGLPTLKTHGSRVKDALQHVVYTRNSSGHERVYVNGELVKSGTRGGHLTNLDDHFKLALANELSGDRPWLGKIYKVAIYKRDLSAGEVGGNFRAGKCCRTGSQPPTASCDRDILFVVGNTNLNHGDRAVLDKLKSYGYTVQVRSATHARAADANGKGLVVISSTVNSGDVNTKFTHVAVPVLTWESYLYDDLKMTHGSAGHDYGSGSTEQLVQPNPHPIRESVGGTRRVYTRHAPYRWGRPKATATVVSYKPGAAHLAAIFAYDKGAAMAGKNAPAKRIGWYFDNDTPTHLTHDGWRLFRNAVDWATGCGSQQLTYVAPLQLFAEATLETVDLKWATVLQPGESTFTLERLDAESAAWLPLGDFDTDRLAGESVDLRYVDEAPLPGLNTYRVSTRSDAGARTSELRLVTFTPGGDIVAFPNPASEVVRVSLHGMVGYEADIQLVNALGQIVESQHVDEVADQTYELPVGHLPEGSYLVHVRSGAVRHSVPLAVVR